MKTKPQVIKGCLRMSNFCLLAPLQKKKNGGGVPILMHKNVKIYNSQTIFVNWNEIIFTFGFCTANTVVRVFNLHTKPAWKTKFKSENGELCWKFFLYAKLTKSFKKLLDVWPKIFYFYWILSRPWNSISVESP